MKTVIDMCKKVSYNPLEYVDNQPGLMQAEKLLMEVDKTQIAY